MCRSTISERLREARERAKLSQVEAAERLGVRSSSISNWERGQNDPEWERFPQIASIYDCDPLWLMFEIGTIENRRGTASVAFRSERGRPVPRLAMQAVVMDRITQESPLIEVHTYFDCGPRSFVVDITDKSNEPLFSPGDAVAIDPDVLPRPGDMVLAVMKPEERPVFRRYQARTAPTGTKFVELAPLNATWDTDVIHSDADGRIIGVMTEHVTPRR